MAGEWYSLRWGDLATLEYGRALRGHDTNTGRYRVFGTNGPIGWHNEALCAHPSVIIGRKGAYRGVHFSPEPFFVIDTAFFLEPKREIDLRWAYYELLTQDINSLDSGSAIPSTSRESFYNLAVRVPPLSEQRAIAHILGTLDDKIESNRRMSETLEEIARAIFKSWFVDFDPVRAKMEGRDPGLAPDIAALFPDRFAESGIRPEGWTLSKIGDEVRVVGGNTPSTEISEYWGGPHAWATPKDLSKLNSPILLETERGLTDLGLSKVSSGLLPKSTVLLSSRAPIGYVAMASLPVAVNQGFVAMVCDKEVGPYFTYFWTKASHEEIVGRANGSTFLEISKSSFREIPLLRPLPKILRTFEDVARPIFERIELAARQSRTLAALRDLLLPKLMSGEIRIKDAEKLLGEAGA
jgi:type I restriction enzyme, S subunit